MMILHGTWVDLLQKKKRRSGSGTVSTTDSPVLDSELVHNPRTLLQWVSIDILNP